MNLVAASHRRLLIVDDNPSIHEDIRKILLPGSDESPEFDALEASVFGDEPGEPVRESYSIESAFQGEEALELIRRAKAEGAPFSVAFVDMRMPPGWDGLETIENLWREDPELHVVICTAYSDHSREEIVRRTGGTHQLLILRKPFDNVEIAQLASALTEKWLQTRQAALKVDQLEESVQECTAELREANARLQGEVSERERYAEALRRSEERFALAARGSNDGLWDWDRRSDRAFYSPRWKAIIGHDGPEIGDSPREWLSRIHPDDAPAFNAALERHLRGETAHFESEHRLRTREGAYTWVLCRGIAVLDDAGKPLRFAGSMSDLTRRKEAEESLRRSAYFDRLTALPNRASLKESIDRSLARVRSGGHGAATLFLDFDRFKLVNDSMGHHAGDELLRGIAQRLTAALAGREDLAAERTVARLGGDEFVVLLDGTTRPDAAELAAEVLHASMEPPFLIQGAEVHTSASIGIAYADPGYADSDEFLRDCDTAMYHAKHGGRGRAVVFDSRMRDDAIARLRLENDLRRAIDRGELHLVYQPVVCLRAGVIRGFEALARWNHPEHGPVGPDRFIPIAEETGMIGALGEWVIRAAARQLGQWRRSVPEAAGLSMAVNLSARQFSQPSLVNLLMEVLETEGLDGPALCLEITERTVVDDLKGSVATIGRLRALGVNVVLDDFGTGYSCLGCLKELPLTGLKLDRSFVAQVGVGSDYAAIIQCLVALARNLRMTVVAEGIETKEQLAAVLALDCDDGQGYLLAKPMPADEVPGWLATQPAQARSC